MKKVIIIGCGVARLSAGTYLLANGYEVTILEKNSTIGGACIGWDRKGQYIDGCIHWLSGVSPKSNVYPLWRETHAITDDSEFFFQDDLVKNVFCDGTTFTFWADLDKSQRELIELAPEDEKQIKKFISLIRKFRKVNPPADKPVDLMNLADLLKVALTMGGVYYWVAKTSKISCEEYSKKFKNPYIRDFIAHYMAPHYNLMSMLYLLGHVTNKDGAIPIGGSVKLIERMQDRFTSLGGRIVKSAPVSEIIVENDVAVGVKLENSECLYADWVVCTAPPEYTLDVLLDGKYQDKQFARRLADEKNYPIYTYTVVAIKCPRSVADKSLSINYQLEKPIVIDTEYDRVSFRNYGYDATVKSNDDSCVIQATIHSNDGMYYWWKQAKNDGTYKEKKKLIGNELLQIAKTVYPDCADSLELIDVITPCTYERYLNSHHGCFQAFIHTDKGGAIMHDGKIKGLKNFLLCGQWLIQSGGLPPAVMSGRFTAQRICKKDKKKFVTPQ
ncbi:MAG: NAD(P)/FAD-dependent oxidoreductase [Clostridia bacterium]|nr:NAD(P)/FAD-dependent oxidoreductase [Clostridia bacterium]